MNIKISNLADGRFEYLFEDNISKIEIGEPYSDKFKTDIVLTKFGDQIILDAITGVNAKLICDRCAVNFEQMIKSSYRVVYLLKNEEETDQYNNDIVFLHPDADKINISKDVRDFAMLAVPMKRLCKEDCKGLCFKCGKNLNEGKSNCESEKIDPRWEPLLDLSRLSELNTEKDKNLLEKNKDKLN